MKHNLYYNVNVKFIKYKHMFTIENQFKGRIFQSNAEDNIINDVLVYGVKTNVYLVVLGFRKYCRY